MILSVKSGRDEKNLRIHMAFRNRIAQLTTEAAEKAAQLVLTQLSERLNFSQHQSRNDEELECLQFGICSYQPQVQRIIL